MVKYIPKKEIIRAIHVCAGAGVSAWGYNTLGDWVESPIAVEINDIERQSYLANHKINLANFHKDVREYFPSLHDVELITIAILTPPCQAFSSMNPKKDVEQADLLYECLRIIKELKPQHFMIENVVGLKHSYDRQGRRYVDVLGKELKFLGYNIVYDNRPMAQRYIVNAADYGLPENSPM